MFTPENGSVLVGVNQFAIIAPDIDPNKVEYMATDGILTCFGLALFDQEQRVALLSHLTDENDLLSLAKISLPLLKALGARNLRLQTVNLEEQYYFTENEFIDEVKFIAEFIEEIEKVGMQVIKPSKDLGYSDPASFDFISGFQPSIDLGRFTREQYRARLDYDSDFYDYWEGKDVEGPFEEVNPAYVPQLDPSAS